MVTYSTTYLLKVGILKINEVYFAVMRQIDTRLLTHCFPLLQSTTTDDIIFSGMGSDDCFSDDEDDCLTPHGESDDIITPTIIITRISTPKPESRYV